jgi:23S rRNA pseudouridine2605 synthase
MSDNRNKGGRPPRKPGGDAARGSGPRKFGDKPRAPRPFGDKPDARPRKPRAEGEGFEKRASREGFEARPREGFAKRASGEGFAKRPPRDAADRPRAPRPFGDRPDARPRKPRAEGEGFEKRPPRGEFKPRRAPRAPATVESAHEGDRIAKVMARAGLCSRRDAEAWIAEGRVVVNGKRLDSPAYNVLPDDKVMVDGQPLAHRERTRLFMFHKPRGLVTTDKDPEGRQTVFDYLRETWPAGPRVVSVGRLDINTEGLLLLTNDGGLARVLELPSTGWLRRYRVRANGETDQAQLDALMAGVSIDGVDYAGIEAKLDRVQGANVWLTMGLREGKNREIKRVLEHLGLAVNRLIRMSFGPFQLGDLPEGAVEEVRTRVLKDQLGPALAEEAGADFDGPLHEPDRFDDSAPRRAARQPVEDEAPAPRDRSLRPKGPRRHVSALRADRDAEMAGGDRKRIERAATADRKGRTVAVERIVPARPKAEPATTRNARRFKAERAETSGEAPPRRPRVAREGDETRAPRRFEGGPRREASGGDRPARRPSRPTRDFDDARPRRERDGEAPQRREGRADAPRGPRKFEGGERPTRRFDGESKGARPPRAGGPGGKPAGGRPGGGPRGPKPGGFGGKPGGRPGGKPRSPR